jgi:hypothetical protein
MPLCHDKQGRFLRQRAVEPVQLSCRKVAVPQKSVKPWEALPKPRYYGVHRPWVRIPSDADQRSEVMAIAIPK